MTDTRDIETRLRMLSKRLANYFSGVKFAEIDEAANEIASLRKQLEDAEAMQDLAYYNGAKQYAVMAGESEEAAEEWLLGGCGNRQRDAIRALKGKS